jgi:amino acid transporter
VVLIAAELVAITHMFQFEFPSDLLAQANYPEPTLSFNPGISPAVVILAFLPIILIMNLMPVKQFGQMEYIMGSIKMIFIIMMILMNTALHSLQRVSNQQHFWTYNTPYGFASNNITMADRHTVITGGAGRLSGMWEAMTTGVFGLIGIETVAITAAENKDLRTEETIKIATRKICLRLIILYTLATFTVGLNVPYTYPTIADPEVISFGFGQNSAFVVSAVLNRLQGWPKAINCFFIFTALTAGINGCYNASRTLHAIASDRNAWPEWGWAQSIRTRLERTAYGCPYVAVFVSWSFGWLAFLGVDANSGAVRRTFYCTVFLELTSSKGIGSYGSNCGCFHSHRLRCLRRHLSRILQAVSALLVWRPSKLRYIASNKQP